MDQTGSIHSIGCFCPAQNQAGKRDWPSKARWCGGSCSGGGSGSRDRTNRRVRHFEKESKTKHYKAEGDPAPDRLIHIRRQQAVTAVMGGKESFSMLGTWGRQAREENRGKNRGCTSLVMLKIKCCRFPKGQSGQQAMRPCWSLGGGRKSRQCVLRAASARQGKFSSSSGCSGP